METIVRRLRAKVECVREFLGTKRLAEFVRLLDGFLESLITAEQPRSTVSE